MLSPEEIARLQADQFSHDKRYHWDIVTLSRIDRLKHYGLHYAKYVGRLFRTEEVKTPAQTVVDTTLVCLSAANSLQQRLETIDLTIADYTDLRLFFADAMGRFADGCEKIDHMEEFLTLARDANSDVFRWAVAYSAELDVLISDSVAQRRLQLGERQFYVRD